MLDEEKRRKGGGMEDSNNVYRERLIGMRCTRRKGPKDQVVREPLLDLRTGELL